jgi:serine/threonine protein kinase
MFAIKIYDKVKLGEGSKKKAVQREIMLLKKIDHENIVKLYTNFENRRTVSISH